MDGWMHEWTDGQTDGWTCVWMDSYLSDECLGVKRGGIQIDRWTSEWDSGWVNE